MPDPAQPLIGPYQPRPAACRDYDPRAADVARQVAEAMRRQLPQAQVEHVGSTSVFGCAGKGIVDLMIPVPAEAMDSVKGMLDRLGFQRQTNRDPFVEDRPLWAGSLEYDGEMFLLHVHVIPADSPEIDDFRFFRSCLRADPDLLKAYVARKREIIAGGVTDSLDYCHTGTSRPPNIFRRPCGRPSSSGPSTPGENLPATARSC
jgi:GrpB-like predicted nucleotidyltransferase (UPF0157 family)